MKIIDKILMCFVAAIFAGLLIVFICDAIEANRPQPDQAIAHSATELSLYYGGED